MVSGKTRSTIAILALVAAGPAAALGFGDFRAQVLLGQPLNLAVPVSLAEGETLSAECAAAEIQIGESRLQPGMVLNSATGTFLWIPSETQDGIYPVTFRVSDNQGASTDVLISITVREVNTAPQLANPGGKTLNEHTLLTFTLSATESFLNIEGS